MYVPKSRSRVNQNLLVRYEQFLSTLATLHIREEFTVTDGSTQFAQVVDKIADWVQAHVRIAFSFEPINTYPSSSRGLIAVTFVNAAVADVPVTIPGITLGPLTAE